VRLEKAAVPMTRPVRIGSHLEQVLASGQFAVTAELGPPRNADAAAVRAKAERLAPYADAVNVLDNTGASVHMCALAAAVLVQRTGVEPVLQITGRDRNQIALQSDLLGAAALGIQNILCLSGDDPRAGDHPDAKAVMDFDSIRLIQAARKMRDEGAFWSGVPLRGAAPRLFIGSTENPYTQPVEAGVARLAKKIDAGAEFIQTQFVYDLEPFARWLELARAEGLHERAYILAGIGPLRRLRTAEFLRDHIPGVVVPDWVIERLRAADDQAAEGVRIAVEVIAGLRRLPGVAGIHIMPMDWDEGVARVVEAAGLLPRPPRPAPQPAA